MVPSRRGPNIPQEHGTPRPLFGGMVMCLIGLQPPQIVCTMLLNQERFVGLIDQAADVPKLPTFASAPGQAPRDPLRRQCQPFPQGRRLQHLELDIQHDQPVDQRIEGIGAA